MNKSGAPGPLAIVRGFRKHRHISKVGMFSNPGFDLFMQIEIRPCPPAPIKRELPTALPGELIQKNGADRRISSATCEHDCRSEEHTSELPSLMRISYAVFCLTKTKNNSRAESDRLAPKTTITATARHQSKTTRHSITGNVDIT